MALKYDYDIHWVIPRDIHADPELGGLLDDADFQEDARSNYVALFRDPATVEALGKADPELLAFFKACGFGLNTYDSGAPDGFFPAEDLAARNDVTERLTENLPRYALMDKDLGAFDFEAFLDYEMNAEPIDMARPAETDPVRETDKVTSLLARARAALKARSAALNPRSLAIAVLVLVLVPYITQGIGLF